MDWQTIAWRRIADPVVTTSERREIQNHLRVCHEELIRCPAGLNGSAPALAVRRQCRRPQKSSPFNQRMPTTKSAQ